MKEYKSNVFTEYLSIEFVDLISSVNISFSFAKFILQSYSTEFIFNK